MDERSIVKNGFNTTVSYLNYPIKEGTFYEKTYLFSISYHFIV